MLLRAIHSLLKSNLRFPKFYCNTPCNYNSLKVNNVSLCKYVMHIESEYSNLKSKPTLLPDEETRLHVLQPTIDILNQRNNVIEGIKNLKVLLEDKDVGIQKLAEDENQTLREQLEKLEKDLIDSLVPINEDDLSDGIVLEVNSGVGGQEAMLFAKELFEMYSNFACFKNWDFEVVTYLTTDIGGLRHASALVNGKSALQYFQYEAGVHRVQRVPATEKSGRIHTSTVSVLALPQPNDIQITIDKKDLRIETKRASGAGGQHVNTTDSAVRITHVPSNISVECQVDRSQLKNKALAMQKLRALLYEQQLKSDTDLIESVKKTQVKSNYRNEKIRTYNFGQDRITDHRLQGDHVHNIKGFFEGGLPLENLISKLHEKFRIQNLLNEVLKFDSK